MAKRRRADSELDRRKENWLLFIGPLLEDIATPELMKLRRHLRRPLPTGLEKLAILECALNDVLATRKRAEREDRKLAKARRNPTDIHPGDYEPEPETPRGRPSSRPPIEHGSASSDK